MSHQQLTTSHTNGLPDGDALRRNIAIRRLKGHTWRALFFASTVIGMIVLALLLYTVVDEAFGMVAIQQKIDPATLADRPLDQLSQDELVAILKQNVSSGVFRRLESEQPFVERSQADVLALVRERVVKEEIVKSWPLHTTLFSRATIEAQAAKEFPQARLAFHAWLDRDFLTNTMASTPAFAGVRTALLGSLWMIAITMLVAFPIGVGAAIYLEEYASDTLINRLIRTNINNLAGVPSIIYGMLGLAIFVRTLERVTSGAAFGVVGANGRTILSASLTMALLILPVIIINTQEAIRAVPLSIRQASLALGATRWQTIWHHTLPSALPGILTGSILAMSRAIGETAPLIVVGASTFIVSDPSGPFSKFTALPIQIYNWTSRPQDQFRDVAAAAIIVLLVVLLTLNATAVLLRQRFRRSGS